MVLVKAVAEAETPAAGTEEGRAVAVVVVGMAEGVKAVEAAVVVEDV